MLTESSKIYFRTAGLALVAAIVYGPLSRDSTGVVLFLGVAIVAALTGVLFTGRREAPVTVGAADRPAAASPSTGPASPAPLFGAIAAGVVAVGLVYGAAVVLPGVLLAVAVAVWWGALAAGQHRGRPVNLLPVAVPVTVLFVIAATVFFLSRILLAVPEQASTAIALVVALAILFGGFIVASLPRLHPRVIVALLAGVATLLVAGGIVAAAVGERPEEGPAEAGGAVTVTAKNVSFSTKAINAKGGHDVEIHFVNDDNGVPHNIAVYRDENATDAVFKGDLVTGPGSKDYKFAAPPPGTYLFHCDVHPNMSGNLTVS